MADPTFILPAVTSLSMMLLFKFGVDAGHQNAFMQHPGFVYGLPSMLFVGSIAGGFPIATFLYALFTNPPLFFCKGATNRLCCATRHYAGTV